MAFKVLFEGNPFCSPVFCSVTITHCLLVGLKQQVANIQYLKSKQLTSFGTQFLQHLSVPQSRARLLLDSNCKHKKLPFIELSIHLQWIFFIILFSTSHLSLVCWMLKNSIQKVCETQAKQIQFVTAQGHFLCYTCFQLSNRSCHENKYFKKQMNISLLYFQCSSCILAGILAR